MALPLVYNPYYVTSLPAGHRFPMTKFRTIYEMLLQQGIARPEQFQYSGIATKKLLASVHSVQYITAFCTGTLERQALRRIGLPWSTGLVKRTCTAVAGTLLTAELALKYGLACNTAGGTHHAFPEHGAGFCIFNDLAVTARVLIDTEQVRRILIIDLDVHQGDGTAAIFQNDPRVFTFSVHCQQNFPFEKETGDLDISLPTGTDDAAYWQTLRHYLPDLLSQTKPDLVLYDTGVDPHIDDPLGKLALTLDGLNARDQLVLQSCVARGIPVAAVVGGGYDKNMQKLAFRHTLLHRAAKAVFEKHT